MRPGEEKDSDHIFITEEEVDRYKDQIAAYTEINGYQYFTTYDVIDQSDVYVIDPKGVDSLKYKCRDKYRFVEIYVWIPKEIAKERALKRGDDMEKFQSRYADEKLQFEEYESNSDIPYSLRNVRPFNESVEIVCSWIQKELNKRILYVDFDGVIVDSIKAICDLYNEDFSYYSDFKPVDPNDVLTYDFSECNCASKEIIDWYFNTPRFFEKYGCLKFSSRCIPNISDAPITRSIPPAKSQYTYIENKRSANTMCTPEYVFRLENTVFAAT